MSILLLCLSQLKLSPGWELSRDCFIQLKLSCLIFLIGLIGSFFGDSFSQTFLGPQGYTYSIVLSSQVHHFLTKVQIYKIIRYKGP